MKIGSVAINGPTKSHAPAGQGMAVSLRLRWDQRGEGEVESVHWKSG
jgi:hypothetical protein